MKTLWLALISISGLAVSAQAQVLSERAARNVLIGGIAGAIIGDHNDHRALEGALIGAAAGAVWTGLTEGQNHSRVVYSEPCRETRVVYSEPCYDRVVVRHPPERRVVVVRPAPCPDVVIVKRDSRYRDDRFYREDCRDDRPVRHNRKVVVVRDPGCAPRYVEVFD